MSKRIVVFCILSVLFGGLVYGLSPRAGMASRDLNCDAIYDPRARVICRRLERDMQWTWMGHAIISPGWRITFESVRRTYCAESIGPRDIPALDVLRHNTRDWRAASGADYLLRLIRNRDGLGDEDSASVFNPANPLFILKGGCEPS